MFRREKDFNEKLLALRDTKLNVVKTVASLNHEYDQIHDLLRVSADSPLDISVEMDPEEFPEA